MKMFRFIDSQFYHKPDGWIGNSQKSSPRRILPGTSCCSCITGDVGLPKLWKNQSIFSTEIPRYQLSFFVVCEEPILDTDFSMQVMQVLSKSKNYLMAEKKKTLKPPKEDSAFLMMEQKTRPKRNASLRIMFSYFVLKLVWERFQSGLKGKKTCLWDTRQL